MLLSGLAPLAVAAAGAPPGGVGSPQAVLGFGVLAIAAMLALRFTGRRLGDLHRDRHRQRVPTIAALARMVAMTGAVTLLSRVVLVCVLAYQRRAGPVPPAVGYSAARLPVGHQSLGLRGSSRPAHHRGALRRRPACLGRARHRSATCCCRPNARASFLTGLLARAWRFDGGLADRDCPIPTPGSAGCRSCWPASALAS